VRAPLSEGFLPTSQTQARERRASNSVGRFIIPLIRIRAKVCIQEFTRIRAPHSTARTVFPKWISAGLASR